MHTRRMVLQTYASFGPESTDKNILSEQIVAPPIMCELMTPHRVCLFVSCIYEGLCHWQDSTLDHQEIAT